MYYLFLGAVLLLTAKMAIAQDIFVGFSDDPLILVEDNLPFYTLVEQISFDQGECIIYVDFPNGETTAYTDAKGYHIRKLRLAPEVMAHPAFTDRDWDLTIEEVQKLALEVCWPHTS